MRFTINRVICLFLAVFCLSLALHALPCHAAQPEQQAPAPQQQQTISPEALFATMLMNAEKGQPQAMLTVGALYEQGVGVPRHFTKAFE